MPALCIQDKYRAAAVLNMGQCFPLTRVMKQQILWSTQMCTTRRGGTDSSRLELLSAAGRTGLGSGTRAASKPTSHSPPAHHKTISQSSSNLKHLLPASSSNSLCQFPFLISYCIHAFQHVCYTLGSAQVTFIGPSGQSDCTVMEQS